MNKFAEDLMRKHYMLPHEKEPEEAFYRAAHAYHDDDELGDRIYEYVKKGWMMFASPVLSNAPCKKTGEWNGGLPISCFLSYVPDSLEGLIDHTSETRWLSVKGGGVGGHWSDVRAVSDIAPGPIPFIHTVDADMVAYKQGRTRKGSYAAYLDVSHPDLLEFLQFRTPTGGDVNRKCFNIHHAVNITDEFMEAVVNGELWQFKDPKTGEVRGEEPAREVLERIIDTRFRTGEPYLFFIDKANEHLPEEMKEAGLKIRGSNLCVHGDTKILTSSGYRNIKDCAGSTVEVWNGEEFSKVVVAKTGENQEMIRVEFSNGESLTCTPYHKFYLKDGTQVEASGLCVGDKLLKHNMPVVDHGNETLPHAYEQGFFQGDGCIVKNKCRVYLYHEKRDLLPLFSDDLRGAFVEQGEQKRIYFNYPLKPDKGFVPDSSYTIQSRLDWLAGLADADGCIYRNGDNEQLVLSSIDDEFLSGVKRMLDELGCQAKLRKFIEGGKRLLPANNGTGELALFDCAAGYRLIITSNDLKHLLDLGLKFHRLKVSNRTPQRDARRFVIVSSISDVPVYVGDSYCLNEPNRHMAIFNGVLTGQCNEIVLPTDEKRTAVCCLSSVNLAKFDEWKDSNLVQDLTTYLNHVLQFFIDNAPPEFEKAVYSAKTERSIGIGALGFHTLLQEKGIPFESFTATLLNKHVFQTIKERALEQSKRLKNKFPNEFMPDRANTHLLAVAPNANSGILAGVSPSIEPWSGNAYMHRTRIGSHLVKNPTLEKILQEMGKDTEEVWMSILQADGSVQHLDFLDDDVKEIFKTAREIDQHWIVQHAADRQEFLCQSQSVNLFFEEGVDRKYVLSVHLRAWKQGLKGLYYLRAAAAKQGEKVSDKVTRVSLKDFDECLSCQG